MPLLITSDLDYLTARLHGRKSRLAEAARLDELCRLRSIAELGKEIFPGETFQTATALQRRLIANLITEMSENSAQLAAHESRFLAWNLTRFQIENLKILVRGFLNRTAIEELREQLLPLPTASELNAEEFLAAKTLEAFTDLLPHDSLQESFAKILKSHRDDRSPFFFEAALDRGYFQALIARLDSLASEDRELVAPLVSQEIDTFHLMLAVRGRFIHQLKPESLRPLHIAGTTIPRGLFEAMLGDSDLATISHRVIGRVIDSVPQASEPASLESLAWHRFLRLSNRAFRRSHIGFAAVIGYFGIRRIEISNLITLSEGIRLGLPADSIRARLIPRTRMEAADV